MHAAKNAKQEGTQAKDVCKLLDEEKRKSDFLDGHNMTAVFSWIDMQELLEMTEFFAEMPHVFGTIKQTHESLTHE